MSRVTPSGRSPPQSASPSARNQKRGDGLRTAPQRTPLSHEKPPSPPLVPHVGYLSIRFPCPFFSSLTVVPLFLSEVSSCFCIRVSLFSRSPSFCGCRQREIATCMPVVSVSRSKRTGFAVTVGFSASLLETYSSNTFLTLAGRNYWYAFGRFRSGGYESTNNKNGCACQRIITSNNCFCVVSSAPRIHGFDACAHHKDWPFCSFSAEKMNKTIRFHHSLPTPPLPVSHPLPLFFLPSSPESFPPLYSPLLSPTFYASHHRPLSL